MIKGNKYDLSNEYGIGYDSKGESFLFDLEDHKKIKDYTWNVTHKKSNNKPYVTASLIGTGKIIYMHRLIMNAGKYNYYNPIDHINNNSTDNRKSNLRFATPTQNNYNTKTKPNNISGVTGVHYEKNKGKWRAEIGRKKLGRYNTKDEAIKARLLAEVEICGEFAPQKYLFQKYKINIL